MEYKKGTKNNSNKYETVTNMVDINPMISIIILNTNGINTPIKRQRLSQRIDKQDPNIRKYLKR